MGKNIWGRVAVASLLGLIVTCAWSQAYSESSSTGKVRSDASLRVDRVFIDGQGSPAVVDSQYPRFRWTLAPALTSSRGLTQTAYRILVASSQAALLQGKGDIWDSGKIDSSQTADVIYAGKPLESHRRYFWRLCAWDEGHRRTAWSESSTMLTGMMSDKDWKAHWIATAADLPQPPPAQDGVSDVKIKTNGMPLFRHDFTASKPIESAIVFASGLGQYELRINGRNVTDSVLNPGWTDYRKSVLYNTFDVTALLRPGANALGVLLGNGMYNVEEQRGRYTKFAGSVGQPKMILELHLLYTDGSEAVVLSDQSWKTHAGPITYSSTYGGEDFDARMETAGWANPGFAASGWSDVSQVDGPGGRLRMQKNQPVRAMQEYKPAAITEPRPGLLVYDLGQNMSGWPEIEVVGHAGDTVKLIAGELLNSDGSVSQHSANADPEHENSYSYTLRGGASETWHPRFSYWGFRYVQVEGAVRVRKAGNTKPLLVSLRGEFLHDSLATIGKFTTSDASINKIHKLIDMAILSNSFSVLTDCPHREKLGWLEQTYLNGSSLFYNYDYGALYAKMSEDMQEAQLPDGMVPGIAPEYVAFVDANGVNTAFRDSPEWGSASILSPWTAYRFGGDSQALKAAYPMMQRYVDYLSSKTVNGLLSHGLGDWYDIGPGEPGYSQLTSKEVTATGTFYDDLLVLAKVAKLLDKPQDAVLYMAKADEVKEKFNAKLFHADTNQYDRGSQTANAMALAEGLVPAGKESAVLESLVADIRNHGNHVTAGDVGFHYVVRALTDGGRSDVLYDMLSRTDSPSYGYQLSQGATTLTEAWDTNPSSSQNHFMLGHAEEWFYRGLAGIHIDMSLEAKQRISIRPQPVGDIKSASASYDSVLGFIKSSWTRTGRNYQFEVTIPPNSEATVELPASNPGSFLIGGSPIGEGTGKHCRASDGSVTCVISSGTYQFTSHL